MTASSDRLGDLAVDAWQGVSRRRVRSALTALGTVAGIAALVAILGLTATIQVQISNRFTLLSAIQVTVAVPPELRALDEDQIVDRISRLNGVETAGLFSTVDSGDAAPIAVSRIPGDQLNAVTPPVVAASRQGLATRRPRLVAGRLPSAWHEATAAVAVLGQALARDLGVDLTPGRSSIDVRGHAVAVLAIVADADDRTDLTLSLLLPPRLVDEFELAGPDRPREFVVRTRPGAAQQLAREIPVAVHPADPGLVAADAPPDQRQLRRKVAADTQSLLLVLAAVCLVIGAVGIANATLVSVLERRAEIGVLRAMGASRTAIVGQFLLESVLLGAAGGLVGTVLGLAVVAAVAFAKHWTIAVPPGIAAAPLLGAVVGMAAGAYPALRAARVDPIQVLRG
jgi:putative ABC transport system permease protein